MKKIISLMMVIAVLLSFAACTSEKPGENENTTSPSSVTKPETPSDPTVPDQSEIKEDEPNSETKTVKVPGKDIYVSCNTSLRTTEQSRTIIMYDSEDVLVGLTFDKSEYNGDLKDVVALLNDKFMGNISGYSKGYLKESKIVVTSSSETSISGFSCEKFEGYAVNDFEETWNCHVYGYSFIIDNIPCAVIGVVSAKEQESSMIEQLDKSVDEIATTIRTTK